MQNSFDAIPDKLFPDILFNTEKKKLYNPRILIIAAHPDDETIFAASVLLNNQNIFLMHITDGVPDKKSEYKRAGFKSRDRYAAVRREEFLNAMRIAEVSPENCYTIDIVDQQTVYNIDKITFQILDVINKLHPDMIFTHPYEGGHPDHDSVAFCVNLALRILKYQDNLIPLHLEFSSYFNSYDRMASFNFLPGHLTLSVKVILSPLEIFVKQKMLDCFFTQEAVIKNFPVIFEILRIAPEYDFTLPPHSGKLYYEFYDFGVTGEQWRKLTSEALLNLKLVEQL